MLTIQTIRSSHQEPAGSNVEKDEILAQRSLNEPEAFAELYQRHVARIYHFHLARTGSAEEAQDLTSQTFLAALNSIQAFSGSGHFCGWLFGIARHKVADYYRSQRKEAYLEMIEDFSDPDPSPEEKVFNQLQLAQVSQALESLIPEQTEAILLRIFGELSASEVGKIMGKSEAAIKMLVYRGLKNLQMKLSPGMEVLR
jgi:RNA polymerase sigma-70 factor (ECF subfamily)